MTPSLLIPPSAFAKSTVWFTPAKKVQRILCYESTIPRHSKWIWCRPEGRVCWRRSKAKTCAGQLPTIRSSPSYSSLSSPMIIIIIIIMMLNLGVSLSQSLSPYFRDHSFGFRAMTICRNYRRGTFAVFGAKR